MNTNNFEGRVAIVTGAATGIGLAIAKRFNENGANVVLWDSNLEALKRVHLTFSSLNKIQYFGVDVTNLDEISDATRSVITSFKKIDILVNNAGISGPIAPTWDYPIEDWNNVVNINLNGVFHCCRSIIPKMRENRYGRIINIASIAGKEGNPGAAAYSASKAAVIALTKSLGKELADIGILVNCITPAAVKTDIFKQITQKHIDYMLSKIPMGRLGKVDEIAALVCWLASDECSFSSGAVFDISGGRATY